MYYKLKLILWYKKKVVPVKEPHYSSLNNIVLWKIIYLLVITLNFQEITAPRNKLLRI